MYVDWVAFLAALLIDTLIKGVGHLTPSFFTNFSSSTPSQAGIKGLWLVHYGSC